MKKPEYPYKSGKYISCPEYKETVLKTVIYIDHNFIYDYCLDNDIEYDEDEEGAINKSQNIMVKPMENQNIFDSLSSLQELAASKNLDPNKIFLSITKDRHGSTIAVSCVYREPVSSEDKKRFEKEKKLEHNEWQKRFELYEKQMQEFEIWQAEEHLRKLKEKNGK